MLAVRNGGPCGERDNGKICSCISIAKQNTFSPMKSKSLKKIVKGLENIFRALKDNEVNDHILRQRYAEYLVASILADKGHTVCLLGERQNTEADIYLPDKRIRVEVKSGKIRDRGWTDASFTKGKQIKRKFDYCVFVVFGKSNRERVKHLFVFTRNELLEVTKKRKNVAAFQDSNPCLLLYAPSLKKYDAYIKEEKTTSFKIERALNRNPKRFHRQWGKIK